MGSTLGLWSAFFSTAAESAATLAGLVMVAISVNIQRILAQKHLPMRASGAISALMLVLVMCLAGLIPQTTFAYAVEMDIAALVAWTLHLARLRRFIEGHIEAGRPRRERVLTFILVWVQIVPLAIGGAILSLGHGWGLYVTALAVVAAMIVAVINAWVLLVEILR